MTFFFLLTVEVDRVGQKKEFKVVAIGEWANLPPVQSPFRKFMSKSVQYWLQLILFIYLFLSNPFGFLWRF